MTYSPNNEGPTYHFAGIMIQNDEGKFLVVEHIQKKEFPWRIPGGKVEANELPIAAAARELFEELGITAHSLTLHSEAIQFVDGNNWHGYYFVCDKYRGTPTIQEPAKQGQIRFMRSYDMLPGYTNDATLALARTLEGDGIFWQNGERWIHNAAAGPKRLLDLAPNLEAAWMLEHAAKQMEPGHCVR